MVLFLVLCILFPFGIFTASAEKIAVRLSSLSEEECRQILLDYNVTVPKELNDISVRVLFAALEEDPYRILVINWTTLRNFYEEICMVVKDYYSLPDVVPSNTQNRDTIYPLLYSTFHSWHISMLNYNAYSYAIDRTETAYNPGDFSNAAYYHLESVELLALTVKGDLHCDLGYSCVKLQSERPDSTTGWANVIAVRKDTTLDTEFWDGFETIHFNDFHFAKLTADGWMHKPEDTAVLQFKNAPSNDAVWWNEGYKPTYGYLSADVSYDSQIKYLLYKIDHGSETYLRSTRDHYHKGTKHWFKYEIVCSDCGDAIDTKWISEPCSGPPCLIITPGVLAVDVSDAPD